jgi:hypothetical protein
MQRFPRRIRVPSRKAQEANQTFEIYEDLEARVERLRTTNPPPRETSSTLHSTSEQALLITAQRITTNNFGKATASQLIISRRSRRRAASAFTAEVSATSQLITALLTFTEEPLVTSIIT